MSLTHDETMRVGDTVPTPAGRAHIVSLENGTQTIAVVALVPTGEMRAFPVPVLFAAR
jgi:hypothetical protein